MVARGAEISITGGGAGEKDEGDRGLFFKILFYILYSLVYGTRNRIEL